MRRDDLARLTWAFRRSHLSQAAVEGAVEAASGTLSQLLRGKRAALPVDLARRLAGALDVSVSWLLLGEGAAFWRVRLVDTSPARYLGWYGDSVFREDALTWWRVEDARACLSSVGSVLGKLVVVGARPRLGVVSTEEER